MKLDHYGVRNNTLSWIQDFFSDRTQSVVLEGNSSSTNPIASGVPQGTVLGPLLFLVYINDMPGYAKSQTRLFADDCLMYRKVSSTSDYLTSRRPRQLNQMGTTVADAVQPRQM